MKEENYDIIYSLEKNNWWYKARREMFFLLLKKLNRQFERGLDVGCGTGSNFELLKSFSKEAVGIDFSQKSIDYCKEKGYDKLERMSAEEMKFNDKYFDVILCSDVLEHLKDDKKAIVEMARVLKPGGVLIFSVPAHNYLWGPVDVISKHFRRYEMKEIRREMEKRFNVIRMGYWNSLFFLPNLMFIQASRLMGKEKRAANTLEILPKFMNKILYGAMSIENRLFARFGCAEGVSIVGVCVKD